jgi:hypothetical protein
VTDRGVRTVRVAAVVLLLCGIVVPELFGALTRGYQPMTQYLSELGADDAPWRLAVTWFGFLPVGIAVAIIVVALWRTFAPAALIASGLLAVLGVSIGYLGAVAFPCEPGCVASGAGRQELHDIAGLIEYAGAIAGFGLLGFGLMRVHRALAVSALVAGAVVAVSFALMLMPERDAVKGMLQRGADYSIFLWLAAASFAARDRSAAW